MKLGQNHASEKFVPAAAAQWLVKTLERIELPLKKILLGVRLDKKWLHHPDAVITPADYLKIVKNRPFGNMLLRKCCPPGTVQPVSLPANFL